jgi:hypothetical protein
VGCFLRDSKSPIVHFTLETWTSESQRASAFPGLPQDGCPTLLTFLDYNLVDGACGKKSSTLDFAIPRIPTCQWLPLEIVWNYRVEYFRSYVDNFRPRVCSTLGVQDRPPAVALGARRTQALSGVSGRTFALSNLLSRSWKDRFECLESTFDSCFERSNVEQKYSHQ